MQESYADIATLQAQRIALRLMKHWQHKFEVASTEQNIQIHMPNAMVEMIPTDQHLRVQIRAQQEDVDLPRLQQVVIEHLERMGQEPLQAEWQIQQL